MPDLTTFPMERAEQAVAGSLHPLVAAVHAALEAARTCATIRLPKVLVRLTLRLTDLGQSALTAGANPNTFTNIYSTEWQRVKGVTRFPTLYNAVVALNAAVAACQPGTHRGELPTFTSALVQRAKSAVATGMLTMPVAIDVGGIHIWTDGIVFVIPSTQAQLAATARRQGPKAETARESVQDKLLALREWLVEQQVPDYHFADIYIGRDWSDGPLRFLAVQGHWVSAYDPAAVAVLRGCGANCTYLVDQSTMRRSDGTHPTKRHNNPPVLIGFRGREPVGFCMPLTGDWQPTLARWRGCDTVTTYRGVVL